jgi:N-acetylglucosaminyldiphosphoundecaprenol N-acetyl-beta-D-mannosaminyltransferase
MAYNPMKFPVLGTDINDLNSYEETYKILLDYLHSQNKPAYITVNNVHTITEGLKDNRFREIINNSFLSLPDGKPLSVIGKWKGIKRVERIFGPAFFEKTLEWGVNNNLKHFFFGSSQSTLDKLKKNIEIKFPGLIISGMFSPPFREFSAEENKLFIKEINETNPDIIWISLGAPKQEKWIFENYKNLNRGVMVGIGAGFNYLAGNIKNAPIWMKNLSLEWVYRLKQEPGRLWKRYLVSNTKFILFNLKELITGKFFK